MVNSRVGVSRVGMVGRGGRVLGAALATNKNSIENKASAIKNSVDNKTQQFENISTENKTS